MITMALCETTDNRGTLRKAIWDFIQTTFGDEADYRDFLLVIKELLRQGKLQNNQGYFSIQDTVFNSIWEHNSNPQ